MPDRLFATAGVHPHRASAYTPSTGAILSKLCSTPAVVAVGETGLDYFRLLSPAAVQNEVFASQLQIAVESGLPVFLHQRDAHQDFIRMLKQYRDKLNAAVGALFHRLQDRIV